MLIKVPVADCWKRNIRKIFCKSAVWRIQLWKPSSWTRLQYCKILGIDYAMQEMAVFSEKIEMEEAGFFLPVKKCCKCGRIKKEAEIIRKSVSLWVWKWDGQRSKMQRSISVKRQEGCWQYKTVRIRTISKEKCARVRAKESRGDARIACRYLAQ